LQVLGARGQGMAFVALPRGRSGVVTAEDLRFAREWGGPEATVAQAVNQAVIDLALDLPDAGSGWGRDERGRP